MGTRFKRLAALAGALLLVSSVSGPMIARAAEAGNAQGLRMGTDLFWNYDFTTKVGAGWDKVDWNVTLLFYNNAEVDKVKNSSAMRFSYPFSGGSMYAFMNDGAGGYYDSDRGPKTDTPSCFGDTRHFRIYADADDRMYTTGLGYWVFATTHKDFNELCADYYGDTNGTEADVANRFASKGYTVLRNYSYFYNYEPYHLDPRNKKHRWQCDGYATYIRM
ncbi:hypothetical protein GCM10009554_55420 [Kribbella koreensis]|uniref:Uncharacterized protein n=1 Tax=Kribbella koreensis TaxID=57909 RepID=A0ABP4BN99_9ACTN